MEFINYKLYIIYYILYIIYYILYIIFFNNKYLKIILDYN
jgi:hypothetical protein